jgi:hypothetical protein
MRLSSGLDIVKLVCLIIIGAALHNLILLKRQSIFDWLTRIAGKPVAIFEFPYFLIVAALYTLVIYAGPIYLGLIPLPNGLSDILLDRDRIMYVLFGGGGIMVTAVISGMDIYPVNVFATKESLNHLIAITRDLMKASNRAIIVVSGVVIVGWAFKRIDLTPHVVYLTVYGVLGLILGSTGDLGARLTELLYRLSDLERASGNPET